MQLAEFEALIDNKIGPEAYEKIETVYMWHPSISDTKGKEQIAYLYTEFEMQVIEDMLPRAQKLMNIKMQVDALKVQIRTLEKTAMKISNL